MSKEREHHWYDSVTHELHEAEKKAAHAIEHDAEQTAHDLQILQDACDRQTIMHPVLCAFIVGIIFVAIFMVCILLQGQVISFI